MHNHWRPSLLVGLGGTGVRTLRFVKSLANEGCLPHLRQALDQNYIQLLAFDTDPKSNSAGEVIDQKLVNLFHPSRLAREVLPRHLATLDHFVPLDRKLVNEAVPRLHLDGLTTPIEGDERDGLGFHHAKRWFPAPNEETGDRLTLGHSRGEGASQWRSLGRLSVFLQSRDVYKHLFDAVKRVPAGVFNDDPLDVYLVCSLAGGTGSGTFWDIAFLLQSLPVQVKIHAFFVLGDAFEGVDTGGRINANVYAALKEIAYLKNWRKGIDVQYPFENKVFPPKGKTTYPLDVVYLFRSFSPGAGVQDVLKATIEVTCYRVAQNILSHIRTDFHREFQIGANNMNGDESADSESAERGFVFSTCSSIWFSPVEVERYLFKKMRDFCLNSLPEEFTSEVVPRVESTSVGLGETQRVEIHDLDKKVAKITSVFEAFFKELERLFIARVKEGVNLLDPDLENIKKRLKKSKIVVDNNVISDLKFFSQEFSSFVNKMFGKMDDDQDDVRSGQNQVFRYDFAKSVDFLETLKKEKQKLDNQLKEWKSEVEQNVSKLASEDWIKQISILKSRVGEIHEEFFRRNRKENDSEFALSVPGVWNKLKDSIFDPESRNAFEKFGFRIFLGIGLWRKYINGIMYQVIDDLVLQKEKGVERILNDKSVLDSLYTNYEKEINIARDDVLNMLEGCERILSDKIEDNAKRKGVIDNQILTVKMKVDGYQKDIKRWKTSFRRFKGIQDEEHFDEKMDVSQLLKNLVSEEASEIDNDKATAAWAEIICKDIKSLLKEEDERSPNSHLKYLNEIKPETWTELIRRWRHRLVKGKKSSHLPGLEPPIDFLLCLMLPGPWLVLPKNKSREDFLNEPWLGFEEERLPKLAENVSADSYIECLERVMALVLNYCVVELNQSILCGDGEDSLRERLYRAKSRVFCDGIGENNLARRFLFILPKLPDPKLNQDKYDELLVMYDRLSREVLRIKPTIKESKAKAPVVFFSDMFRAADEIDRIEVYYNAYQAVHPKSRAFYHIHRDIASFPEILNKAGDYQVTCGNPGCNHNIRFEPKSLRFCPGCQKPILNRCGNEDCTKSNLFEYFRKSFLEKDKKTRQNPRYCPECSGFLHNYYWICKHHPDEPVPADKLTCPHCHIEAQQSERALENMGTRDDVSHFFCHGCRHSESDQRYAVPKNLERFYREGVNGFDSAVFSELVQQLSRNKLGFDGFSCPNHQRFHKLIPTCPIYSGSPEKRHHLYAVSGDSGRRFVCGQHNELVFYQCGCCEYPILYEEGKEKERCPRCRSELIYCSVCSDRFRHYQPPLLEESILRCGHCRSNIDERDGYYKKHAEEAGFCRNLFDCNLGRHPFSKSSKYDLKHCPSCPEVRQVLLPQDHLRPALTACSLCSEVYKHLPDFKKYGSSLSDITQADRTTKKTKKESFCILCGLPHAFVERWRTNGSGQKDSEGVGNVDGDQPGKDRLSEVYLDLSGKPLLWPLSVEFETAVSMFKVFVQGQAGRSAMTEIASLCGVEPGEADNDQLAEFRELNNLFAAGPWGKPLKRITREIEALFRDYKKRLFNES